MWPDWVSNPGPLTYESGALSTALRGPGVIRVCRLMVNNETSYDSVVLTKDTGVIRELPIDCDQ